MASARRCGKSLLAHEVVVYGISIFNPHRLKPLSLAIHRGHWKERRISRTFPSSGPECEMKDERSTSIEDEKDEEKGRKKGTNVQSKSGRVENVWGGCRRLYLSPRTVAERPAL